jgi:hypothetical protein
VDKSNTNEFSDEEIQLIDLFQKYIPKVLSKIKGKKTKVIDEVDTMVEPSLNPTLIGLSDKDLDVIENLIRTKGFSFTSEIMMVHLLLIITKLNKFDNEEDLVDYLRDVGGLEIHKISHILHNYNGVKDDFTNGKTIGEIPLDYLENRKYGKREYDEDGNKVLKWKGVSK